MIEFKNVWLMHRISFLLRHRLEWENFWAVKDVGFRIIPGETVGIIGENGAGKTTVLKLIAGLLSPDRGEVRVNASVSGLLGLGAGVQPELSGRENIFACAAIYGMPREAIEPRCEEICRFAGLGKFIDAPVKCYSSGMFIRLAFSLAAHMDPEIFLVDDTLTVGDEYFQKKCLDKLLEFREQGKTMVIVSHDINVLRRFTRRVILLKEGRLVRDGDIDFVSRLYSQTLSSRGGSRVFECGDVTCIFNSGRLFLNRKEVPFTAGGGIHAAIQVGDNWYGPEEAAWQLQPEANGAIRAEGHFFRQGLIQVWRMKPGEGGSIEMQIELRAEDPSLLLEGRFNLMLSEEYSNWFTVTEAGSFGEFGPGQARWHSYLRERTQGRGLAATGGDGVPVILVEAGSGPAPEIGVYDTDSRVRGRVLQFKFVRQKNAVGRMFSGTIHFDRKDWKEKLEDLKEELRADDLSVLADQDGFQLMWQRRPVLTRSLTFHYDLNGRRAEPDNLNREVRREPDSLIYVTAWPGLPLRQVVRWRRGGKNKLALFVELEVEEEVELTEMFAQFMFKEQYALAETVLGKIELPEFMAEERDVLQRCLIEGEIRLRAPGKDLPVVTVTFSPQLENFAKIFNSDRYYRSRILRIGRLQPEDGQHLAAGTYPCFQMEITMEDDSRRMTADRAELLSSKDLGIIISPGSGELRQAKLSLTKKMAFYTALRYAGRWYVSMSGASWNFMKVCSEEIRMRGRWLYLPVEQVWRIAPVADGFDLEIEQTFERPLQLERYQVNLMLSEGYEGWRAGEQTGLFPAFSRDLDEDWQVVASADSKETVSVFSKNLPLLTFSGSGPKGGLQVLNSDLQFRGRVLRWSAAETSAGTQSLFKGRILIRDGS